MADFLALDWDDQRLVGVAAQVAGKGIQLRAVLDFTWADGERPSENADAAGKRLKTELESNGVSPAPVLVSLPREEAVVRLLELPDCTDDELPELVRFQAATRSAIPLERLLLDYLPLPAVTGVVGRPAWMVTIGKPVADRVQTLLTSSGLEAAAIQLSSLGAAELVVRQPGAATSDAASAIMVVSCVDQRVEITAVWQNRIVLMHAASLSGHDPIEDQMSQVLAEAARSSVALSQAAPGLKVGAGWVIGSTLSAVDLAKGLTEQFGFAFHTLEKPAATPGISGEEHTAAANSPLAVGPLGLLLGQGNRQIDPIDFLHPRRQTARPDRRKLWIALGATAAVLAVLLVYGLIQRRVWQLDAEIVKLNTQIQDGQKLMDKHAPLRETATSLEEWNRRDIDWLDQFHDIEQAKGGADKMHLSTFDANVASRNAMALIVASGRAKSRDDVEEFEDRLHDMGYRVTPKEISEDPSDPQYPVKIDVNLELVELRPRPAQPPAAKPATSAAGQSTSGATAPGRSGSTQPAPASSGQASPGRTSPGQAAPNQATPSQPRSTPSDARPQPIERPAAKAASSQPTPAQVTPTLPAAKQASGDQPASAAPVATSVVSETEVSTPAAGAAAPVQASPVPTK